MALNPSVVTLEGYNATLRPEISLDNVQFDNINPEVAVAVGVRDSSTSGPAR